jgi:hypothetical protein
MSRLSDLHPAFEPYAAAILKALQSLDPSFVVTSTVRSKRAQEALYAAYRAGKHPLTVARPGCSKHEGGWAVDIARGKVPPLQDRYLHLVGQKWRSLGGEWGGEKDPVHFALPGKVCQ